MNESKSSSIFKNITSFIKKHTFIFAFLSGLIYAIPFMVEWLFPLIFFALVTFFYTLNSREKRGDFRSFFLFFFGTYLVVYTLFFKLYPFEGFSFSEFQGKAIVIFAWIAVSLIHSTMGAFVLSFSRFFKKEPLSYAISCGALWIIYEWTLSLGELAFPWINVSIGFVKFLPYLQTASLFGNGIITFVTVFFSCALALFLFCKNKKYLLKIASLILCANLLIGTILFIIPEKKEKEISALIVQGNVSMGDKWKSSNFTEILNNHVILINKAFENNTYDVVLMAETVFPKSFYENGFIHTQLSKIASDYSTTIIFGVILTEDNQKFNGIMAIYPDGTVSEPYYKQKLVPFGETIPYMGIFDIIFPALNDLNMDSSYVEGTECRVISDHNGNVYGPLVCYDSVFSDFSRENILLGAEILAVSTNDSWYKDGAAVSQHQSHSIIRAIETGRYVFRSANTGISCIISSKGKIIEESGIMTEETIGAKGYALTHKTLYVILGNVSLYLAFISLPALFTVKKIKEKISQK